MSDFLVALKLHQIKKNVVQTEVTIYKQNCGLIFPVILPVLVVSIQVKWTGD